MKAFMKVTTGRGCMELRDIPVPECPDDGVLMEVKAAGICGSDVHMYEGMANYEWTEPFMPFVAGHEFAGIITEVGKNVKNFKPGDRIACRPTITCGHCHYCVSGHMNFCEAKHHNVRGFSSNGGFAKYSAFPVGSCVRIPDNVTYEQAALIEPMAVTSNAVNDAHILLGDTVVITGPGTIGLMIMLFARAAGAGTIIITGTKKDATRLAMAKELGANYAFMSDEVDVKEKVMELTDGYGANVMFEAAGVTSLIDWGLSIVQKAGTVVAAGIYPGFASINLTPMVRSAKKLIGTYGGSVTWERLLQWMAANPDFSERFSKLITHRTNINDAVAAFERSVAKENVKEMFTSFD